MVDMVSQVDKHEHMCIKHCLYTCFWLVVKNGCVHTLSVLQYLCWVAGDSKHATPLGTASNNMQNTIL